MTTRRDFLKGFAALASGLVLARRETLAEVQRLGTPAEWVEPDDFAPYNQTYRFKHNAFYTARSGWSDDPGTWEGNVVPPPGARVVVVSGTTLTLGPKALPIRLEEGCIQRWQPYWMDNL